MAEGEKPKSTDRVKDWRTSAVKDLTDYYGQEGQPTKFIAEKVIGLADKTLGAAAFKGADIAGTVVGKAPFEAAKFRAHYAKFIYEGSEQRAAEAVKQQIQDLSETNIHNVVIPSGFVRPRTVLQFERDFSDNGAPSQLYQDFKAEIHKKPNLDDKLKAVKRLAEVYVQQYLGLDPARSDEMKDIGRYHLVVARTFEAFLKLFEVMNNTLSADDLSRSTVEVATAGFIRKRLDDKKVFEQSGSVVRFKGENIFSESVMRGVNGLNITGGSETVISRKLFRGGPTVEILRNKLSRAGGKATFEFDLHNIPWNGAAGPLRPEDARVALGLNVDGTEIAAGAAVGNPEEFFRSHIYQPLRAMIIHKNPLFTGIGGERLTRSQQWAFIRAITEKVYHLWLKEIDPKGVLSEKVYGKSSDEDIAKSSLLSKVKSDNKVRDMAWEGLGTQLAGGVLVAEKEFAIPEIQILVRSRSISPDLAKNFSDMVRKVGIEIKNGRADTSTSKTPKGAEKINDFLGVKDTQITDSSAGKLVDKFKQLEQFAAAINSLGPRQNIEKERLVDLVETLQGILVPLGQEIVSEIIGSQTTNKDATKKALGRLTGLVPAASRISHAPRIAATTYAYDQEKVKDILAETAKLQLGNPPEKTLDLLAFMLNVPKELLKRHVTDPSKIDETRREYQSTFAAFDAADKPTKLVMQDLWLNKVTGPEGITKDSFKKMRETLLLAAGTYTDVPYLRTVNFRGNLGPSSPTLSDFTTAIDASRISVQDFLTKLDTVLSGDESTKTQVIRLFAEALESAKNSLSGADFVAWQTNMRRVGLGNYVDKVSSILTTEKSVWLNTKNLADFAEAWWAVMLPVRGNKTAIIDNNKGLFGLTAEDRKKPSAITLIGNIESIVSRFLSDNQRIYVLFQTENANKIRKGVENAVRATTPAERINATFESVREFIIASIRKGETTPYIAKVLDLYNLAPREATVVLARLMTDPTINSSLTRNRVGIQATRVASTATTVGFTDKLFSNMAVLETWYENLSNPAGAILPNAAQEVQIRTALRQIRNIYPQAAPDIGTMRDNLREFTNTTKTLNSLAAAFDGRGVPANIIVSLQSQARIAESVDIITAGINPTNIEDRLGKTLAGFNYLNVRYP